MNKQYIFSQALRYKAGCDTRPIYLAEFNKFASKIFFLLDQLSWQG